MTEQEARSIMDNGFDKVKPIVDKMTTLLMDAYQQGFLTGMEIGKHFTIKEG